MYRYLAAYFTIVAVLSAVVALAGLPRIEPLPLWILSFGSVSLAYLFFLKHRQKEKGLKSLSA